jgi:hypothetical protein
MDDDEEETEDAEVEDPDPDAEATEEEDDQETERTANGQPAEPTNHGENRTMPETTTDSKARGTTNPGPWRGRRRDRTRTHFYS